MIYVMGIILLIIALYVVYKNMNKFDWKKFQYELGLSESTNNYRSVNSIGALGRYQFMPSTIREVAKKLKIPVPSKEQFLNDSNLQDKFFFTYANEIKNYMEKNLNRFIGTHITGATNKITVPVNIYGLVGGAWLGGIGGVENLLINNLDRSDGQTYISDYIAKFSKLIT